MNDASLRYVCLKFDTFCLINGGGAAIEFPVKCQCIYLSNSKNIKGTLSHFYRDGMAPEIQRI